MVSSAKETQLDGKVAVITGASSGIGAAVAQQLSARGAKLLLSASSEKRLAPLGEALGASVLPLDLAHDQDAPAKLLQAAQEAFGRVDVLINNAGLMIEGEVDAIDFDRTRSMLRVNLEAAIMIALRFAKAFKAQGSGDIVSTSSIAGYKTGPKLGAYNATKFGLEAFMDALRLELAGTGVRVASIAPGTVATALYDKWDATAKDWIFSGGALEADDVADAILFALTRPQHVSTPRLLIVPRDLPL